MRPIRFRAWDRIEKKMWSGAVKDGQDPGDSRARGVNGMIEWAQDNSFVLLQFTGLTDRNRREIYEGDVVRTGLHEDDKPRIVEWWRGNQGFRPVMFEETTEVIGNIYENPDLLTK